MNANVNVNEQCKKRVIDYVMHFGKPLNDQLINWTLSNFTFNPKYQTFTTMLVGHIYQKQYTRQTFIERLKQASLNKQALNFIQFIQEPNDNNYCVQWRGDFTTDFSVASPHWKITSFFDSDFKFIKQIFEQQMNGPTEECSAPPISWKDASQFKNK